MKPPKINMNYEINVINYLNVKLKTQYYRLSIL